MGLASTGVACELWICCLVIRWQTLEKPTETPPQDEAGVKVEAESKLVVPFLDDDDDEDEEDDVQEDNIVPASGASDSAAVAPLPEPHCETTASSNAVAPPVG